VLHPASQKLVSLRRLQGAEPREAPANQQAANSSIEKVEHQPQLAVEGRINHLGDRRLRGGGASRASSSDEPLCQRGKGAALRFAKDARRGQSRRGAC